MDDADEPVTGFLGVVATALVAILVVATIGGGILYVTGLVLR